MTVARARAKKPTSVDEITRVLRIYDLLTEEVDRRLRPTGVGGTPIIFGPDSTITYGPVTYDILAVAERIAARTED